MGLTMWLTLFELYWRTQRRTIGMLSLVILAITLGQYIAVTQAIELNVSHFFRHLWIMFSIGNKIAMSVDYKKWPVSGLAIGTQYLNGFINKVGPPAEVAPALYVGSADVVSLVLFGFIVCDIFDFFIVNRLLDELGKRWRDTFERTDEEDEKN